MWLIEDKKPLKADSKASCSRELTLTDVCSVSGVSPPPLVHLVALHSSPAP